MAGLNTGGSSMSLWSSKIVYLFLDTNDITAQRRFFEDGLGLEVIEKDYHPPHHRHGVMKYDAGNTILALNLADSAFESGGSDRVVTVLSADPVREAKIYAELQVGGFTAPQHPGGIFCDRNNHNFMVRSAPFVEYSDAPPTIDELHFEVNDLAESMQFYSELLNLELIRKSAESLTFTTVNMKLVLHSRPDRKQVVPRREFLTVFSTEDIQGTYSSLQERGVKFRAPVRFSEIGGTVRFVDPTGHVFCLYEPSQACQMWGSGPKLMEIMAAGRSLHSRTILQ
jgi:predicted enzyme related to lactoylglutathione lyase